MMSGFFITFEGGEGAGKSTQIDKTADYLTDMGHQVLKTREPGGADGAEKIREILVSGEADQWNDLTECLLMNAARAEHLAKKIRPALNAGKIVLCDRFMDSTRAYQGGAGGVDMQALRQIEAAVVGDTVPDLTFILDLPVEDGLQRADARGGADRFERKGKVYHQNVRDAFLEIAANEPSRCAIINAACSVETVFADLKAILQTRLKLGKNQLP